MDKRDLFVPHWAQGCTAPKLVLNARLGDEPKGASPDLGRGVHAFLCVVSGWHCVKKYDGVIQVRGFDCIEGGSVPTPQSC